MQTVDSLLIQDLSQFHVSADSNPLIPQIVSDPQKKESLKRSVASVQAKKRKYYWTPFQQRRYVKFLIENTELCSLSLNERKARKVNHLMSKRVKTRNPAQCHTHHQKMFEKYKDIPAIIQNHRHLIDSPTGTKSDTNIIQSSYDAKQGNQIREWKSVDQILMNIGLYEIGGVNSDRFDRGMDLLDQEDDLFNEDWLRQREWIEW